MNNKTSTFKAFLIAIGILSLAGTAIKACETENCHKCGEAMEVSMKFNDKHMCSRCYDIDKRASDRYWQKVSEHYRNNQIYK